MSNGNLEGGLEQMTLSTLADPTPDPIADFYWHVTCPRGCEYDDANHRVPLVSGCCGLDGTGFIAERREGVPPKPPLSEG